MATPGAAPSVFVGGGVARRSAYHERRRAERADAGRAADELGDGAEVGSISAEGENQRKAACAFEKSAPDWPTGPGPSPRHRKSSQMEGTLSHFWPLPSLGAHAGRVAETTQHTAI